MRWTVRRLRWFSDDLTVRKALNMATAGAEFTMKREKVVSQPVVFKIDISPLCNLHCTFCVHAKPHGNPALEKQRFHGKQRMTVEQYRRIIEEIKGTATAVSLYYLGDPMVHPDMDEMCHIAHVAGLNVHVSTNFSLSLSDERIRRIVQGGVTHLTVCVDGLHQSTYELTRVGGRIGLVISNLRRLCEYRRRIRRCSPRVEVQCLRFRHNEGELGEARQVFDQLGVDQVTEFPGAWPRNCTDDDPGAYTVFGPKSAPRVPRCFWPYFAMLIKYNGDVIPCCSHRLGHQYSATDDPRVLGNVFRTSVREVWNSRPYQQMRRFVSDPSLIERDAALGEHFCNDCYIIFDTDRYSSPRERIVRQARIDRLDAASHMSAASRS
ncbi:MAG: radical SAM protein [bacterium]|nr:radical SAM protein [bacterium]